MFQDSKSGQTHFENDGCGESAHNKPEKWEEEFVEKGADIEHNRWSKWQKHLHSRCIPQEDGSLLIPADLVQRWERQIATNYSDLSESEKESDRKEARTYIPLVRQAISEAVEEERKRIANCLSGINWTHSQTGIAIGTKKAVIAEALSIINKE